MILEDKVAIVTGGARDIGRAVSVKLATEGAKVVVNYYASEEQATETLEAIEAVGGEGRAQPRLDLTPGPQDGRQHADRRQVTLPHVRAEPAEWMIGRRGHGRRVVGGVTRPPGARG